LTVTRDVICIVWCWVINRYGRWLYTSLWYSRRSRCKQRICIWGLLRCRVQKSGAAPRFWKWGTNSASEENFL